MGDPFKLKSSGSSSSFGARHKDVFNFEEVSLKRPNKKEKTDEDPDRRAVDAKDFKGRRSLYHEEDEDRAVRRNVATADKFAAFRDRRRGADGGAVFKRPARPPPAGSRRRERDPSKYTKYRSVTSNSTTHYRVFLVSLEGFRVQVSLCHVFAHPVSASLSTHSFPAWPTWMS